MFIFLYNNYIVEFLLFHYKVKEMTNIQYIINILRNNLDSIDYLKKADYDKLSIGLDSLEQELLYRDDFNDYVNDIDDYNSIEDEDVYD